MTAEQLRAARREHWRQDRNPILISDDARAWFERHPLSLFLPRRPQLPAPAPSFVEAVEGQANPTPPLSAAENAVEMLAGLIDSGAVIPLNLLGGLGEQPDFLAQAEILPFLVSLRGDRDWKQAPASAGGRHVSPLMLDLWALLEREGPSTVAVAREKLGRELTGSAVLRALSELWQRLRVIPVLQAGGKPAVWELLKHRHSRALATGSGTSQVTAISVLVSTYLQSVYTASGEEIEVFLSPLVSRSRIREAVRGLSATRQIQSLSMETQTYYFLEGGLPEFAPVAVPEGEGEETALGGASRATEATTQEEARQQAPKLPPLPSGAVPLRTAFRPAARRSPGPKQGEQRANRAPRRFESGSRGGFPNRFPDRSKDRSKDRFPDRLNDRSRNRASAGSGQPPSRTPNWRQRDAGGLHEPGKYRRPTAPPKARWPRESGRETTGAPEHRPSKEGWKSQHAVSNRQAPRGGEKWRRFPDSGEPGRPRIQGKRDGTRPDDRRNDQRNLSKPRGTGRPPAYSGGAGRPFRPGNLRGKEDRPKGGSSGFAPWKSGRKFDPSSYAPKIRGANPRNSNMRSRDARRNPDAPNRQVSRGTRAPGGFAPAKPNRDRNKPAGRAPGEGFRPKPKWRKTEVRPQSGPQREAGAQEKRPPRSPKPGAGSFAARKFGSGKFQDGNSGSRPPKTGSQSGGLPRQPGFRGKKTQASFPGKKWPKKKPEA